MSGAMPGTLGVVTSSNNVLTVRPRGTRRRFAPSVGSVVPDAVGPVIAVLLNDPSTAPAHY